MKNHASFILMSHNKINIKKKKHKIKYYFSIYA